jgi:hypothetical protein
VLSHALSLQGKFVDGHANNDEFDEFPYLIRFSSSCVSVFGDSIVIYVLYTTSGHVTKPKSLAATRYKLDRPFDLSILAKDLLSYHAASTNRSLA